MLRKPRAYAGAHDATRPHRTVVSNLLAMQARLRGDAVVPVHPSARLAPSTQSETATAPAVEPPPAEEDGPIAPVIALPGAAVEPVRNPDDDVRRALQRLIELEARLEGLQLDLFALIDRLEPDGEAAGRVRGTPEDAIVRLQRLIDRRLGSS